MSPFCLPETVADLHSEIERLRTESSDTTLSQRRELFVSIACLLRSGIKYDDLRALDPLAAENLARSMLRNNVSRLAQLMEGMKGAADGMRWYINSVPEEVRPNLERLLKSAIQSSNAAF